MAKNKEIWTESAISLTKELHQEISLSNKNWHKLRGNKARRSGELIVGALSQVINGGKNEDISNLLKQAIKWLDGEITDNGCEHH